MHRIIDEQLTAALAAGGVPAADICDDAEFLRRLYLDLTGVIPPRETVLAFLADENPQKRVAAIDRLLASEAYARRMAVAFDVMLMERRPDKYITTDEWRAYLQASFATNKPLDQLAAEVLGATGREPELRPAARFFLDREVEQDVLVRDIGRLFLGADLQCAQCHDHPDIAGYLHHHYHGLAVFVSGLKIFKREGQISLQEKAVREIEFLSVFDLDNPQKTGPRLFEAVFETPALVVGEEYQEKPSAQTPMLPKFSLQQLLARRLPSAATPAFGRNLANRLWAMMLGQGLVEPLDMQHADNPPSHPELLAALTEHLEATGYDARDFLREIALSDAYQRSSLLPADVDPARLPPESFGVANLKSLSPEQLFDSLLSAAEAAPLLARQIEQTLQEDAAAYQKLQDDPAALAAAQSQGRAERLAEFVMLFGSPPGQPEGPFQASLPQSLFLANSPLVQDWIEPADDNLAGRLLAEPDAEKVADELYLCVLSRRPTAAEKELVQQHLESRGEARRLAVTELLWATIASAEFRFNH
ncbi:DUF1549 domain-containing protein [Lignipirellula cremea]|uniref:DUF1549 domain-containing protein n=1 Tax=Lignipirellula cremea TaxID=2528010 RepID=UPI0018D25A44|nr:DUF1549 domain-containing protein [Lignipirellula cremea]